MNANHPENNAAQNAHIRDYLTHYFNASRVPGFAVAISGPWGAGKTHFIKSFLAENFIGRHNDYVYLSLNGLADIEEIDRALLAEIYPALGWRGLHAVGRVVKATLRYIGVETSLRPADVLKKLETRIFIFDDVERCEVRPIARVLGYINEFVEHDECKVLVIADESKIKSKEYGERKEKIVARTFEIRCSLNEALSAFLEAIEDEDAKRFLQGVAGDIHALVQQSELKNLRILQQALWDFERIYSVLSDRHRENSPAMMAILKMSLALSIELKLDRISIEDIETRPTGLVAAMAKLNGKEPTSLQIAEARYADVDLMDTILSNEVLANSIARGFIDRNKIGESLDRSPYFVKKEEEPAWRAVWHGLLRDDDEFNAAAQKMEEEFEQRIFTEPGEILHVFALRLWLSDLGLLKLSRTDVLAEGKAYVLGLKREKRLPPIPANDIDDLRFGGYGGLGFFESASAEFREFSAFLHQSRLAARADHYPDQAEQLLKDLVEDSSKFYRQLCVTNTSDASFYNVPILAAIDPDVFVDSVLELPSSDQERVFSSFKGRYEHGALRRDLSSEREWLVRVSERLGDAQRRASGINAYRLGKFLEWYIHPYLSEQG